MWPIVSVGFRHNLGRNLGRIFQLNNIVVSEMHVSLGRIAIPAYILSAHRHVDR